MSHASKTIQFVTISLQDEDWQHVETRLETNDAATIRVNIARSRFPNERNRKVCILVHGDLIVGLCLARYLSRSGDVDYMAGIDYLRPLQPPERVKRFVRDMPDEIREIVKEALLAGRPLNALESHEVETTLRSDVLNAFTLDFLVDRLHLTANVNSHAARIQAEQRDALALVLEVAGISSKETLRATDELAAEGLLNDDPYVFGLDGKRSGEVLVIEHDANALDGWKNVTPAGARLGVVTFADPKSKRAKITVQYADGGDLELATGTDLIYSRSVQPGFTMVQYKQMRIEGAVDVYRPNNQQLRIEIERMRSISPTSEKWLESAYDYRLSAEAFYIKLVASDVRRSTNNKLADGMYFPLGMFELMMHDPNFRGPRGGQAITTRNAPKHVGNDLFVELLKGGWIGSVGEGTESIKRVVEERLSQGRSLMVTMHHAEPKALSRSLGI